MQLYKHNMMGPGAQIYKIKCRSSDYAALSPKIVVASPYHF